MAEYLEYTVEGATLEAAADSIRNIMNLRKFEISPDVIKELPFDINKPSEDLIFGEYSTGGLEVIGYTGTESIVVIPDYYNGKLVESIASGAFDNTNNLEAVVIPRTIQHIEGIGVQGEELYYVGAPEEWSSINMEEWVAQMIETYYTVHFCAGSNFLIENSVVVHYREAFDVGVTTYQLEPVEKTIGAYDYCSNNEGDTVPVLYKIAEDGWVDDEDMFFYEGTSEIDGVIYDKWRKIEWGDYTWDTTARYYIYTNPIVINNSLSPDEMIDKLDETYDGLTNQTDLISQIQAALEGKALGGITDHSIEDALITRDFDGVAGSSCSYTNERVSIIGNYAFAGSERLAEVAFPKCSTIGRSAFEGCTSLVSATFSECIIQDNAFANCDNLSTFTMTSANYGVSASINAMAFSGCHNLHRIILYPGYVVDLAQAENFGNSQASLEIWVNGLVMSDYLSDPIWGALASDLKAIPTYTNDEGEIVCGEIEIE